MAIFQNNRVSTCVTSVPIPFTFTRKWTFPSGKRTTENKQDRKKTTPFNKAMGIPTQPDKSAPVQARKAPARPDKSVTAQNKQNLANSWSGVGSFCF